MSQWHTISARFTSEEKAKLDELHERFGLAYNQSLRKGVELVGRVIALVELYATLDDKAMKILSKEARNYQKEFKSRIRKKIKEHPDEFTNENYTIFANAMKQTLMPWDIFSQKRKRGRKSEKPGKRGRPRI